MKAWWLGVVRHGGPEVLNDVRWRWEDARSSLRITEPMWRDAICACAHAGLRIKGGRREIVIAGHGASIKKSISPFLGSAVDPLGKREKNIVGEKERSLTTFRISLVFARIYSF